MSINSQIVFSFMGLISYSVIIFSFLIFNTVSTHATLFNINHNININNNNGNNNMNVPNDHDDQSQALYIVRVENSLKPSKYSTVKDWYSSTLVNSTDNNDIIHVYSTVFEGFSAKLSTGQAQHLKERPEVLGVFPSRVLQLHTTRSPEFLGLVTETTTARDDNFDVADLGSDVIIGLMDTGIWPERRSFDDHGMSPIPTRWRGGCYGGKGFPKSKCNKKLVGARYFRKGHVARFGEQGDRNSTPSARDDFGHGTHTASTAAGGRVANASFFGYAPGDSSGIAPKSRIAMYKVCWDGGCLDLDILAGMDAAVRDGVDVISISLGAGATPYDMDPLAIASFTAIKKGIFVSASAGNHGPFPSSLSNVAPWMTTVAAGTIDRTFPAEVILGDGRVITGSSLYAGDEFKGDGDGTYFPLYYGNMTVSRYCLPDSLDPAQVRGKIVICEQGEIPDIGKAEVVKEAGGAGAVIANEAYYSGEGLMALPFLSPGISITYSGRAKLIDYQNSFPDSARATFRFRGTHLDAQPAPLVSFYSSRGPNWLSASVVKPDVIAPGSNILAAWPDRVSASFLSGDNRTTEFNIISGTSMSCPHVSGIAALIRGAHQEWSPAMVKSAMMTTAYNVGRDGRPIMEEASLTKATPMDVGAGHVDPIKAVDPGLVYDLTVEDYIEFLCASHYSSCQIHLITGKNQVSCEKYAKSNTWDLNYPAIAVVLNLSTCGPSEVVEVTVPRRVVHVSDGESTYTVTVTSPEGATVSVDPAEMVFCSKGETQRYAVKISAGYYERTGHKFDHGSLTWTDGKHNVTSPIVVFWN